jgi:hypothetical protein
VCVDAALRVGGIDPGVDETRGSRDVLSSRHNSDADGGERGRRRRRRRLVRREQREVGRKGGHSMLPATRMSIFLTHEPVVLATSKDGLAWTEGPAWLDGRLIFSDTVEESLWEYSDERGLRRLVEHAGGCPGPSAAMHDRVVATLHEERLRRDHTYCPAGQLEPGPNGNTVDNRTSLLVQAQHGGRRVVRRDLSSFAVTDVLASSYGGLPLNSPNDVACAGERPNSSQQLCRARERHLCVATLSGDAAAARMRARAQPLCVTLSRDAYASRAQPAPRRRRRVLYRPVLRLPREPSAAAR